MQIAGTRKRYSWGAILKKGERSAYPLSIILLLPGISHKNIPVLTRKTLITTYPANELKKLLISLLIRFTIVSN